MRASRLNSFAKAAVLVALSVLLSLQVAEYVAGMMLADPRYAIATSQGHEFDNRSRLQVIMECRENSGNCYPSVPPNAFIEKRLQVGNSTLLPLSGVSNATVIGCNESGYYSSYTTDKYGFRNPVGSWPDAGPIDLAFVGDSYTVGDCVNDGDHAVDMLRDSFPHVINLASGGNGPLFELAAIREYLGERDVRYVFWVYFERNDLSDLERDWRVETLRNYLQPGFTQNLAGRYREIDKAMRSFVDDRLVEKIRTTPAVLPNLRTLLWRFRHNQAGPIQAPVTQTQYDLSLFRTILSSAKEAVGNNGGRLVFVYLPEYERFNLDVPAASWSGAPMKDEVLAMVSSLGIDYIDIGPAFRAVADPLDLFPFRVQGHYNRQGHEILAQEIRNYLLRQDDQALDGRDAGRI